MLVLAGYLIWREKLRLLWVLVVGVLSAMAGDNLGFWVGRWALHAARMRKG